MGKQVIIYLYSLYQKLIKYIFLMDELRIKIYYDSDLDVIIYD